MGFGDLIGSIRDAIKRGDSHYKTKFLLKLKETAELTIEAIGKDVRSVSQDEAKRIYDLWSQLKDEFPEFAPWYDSKLPFWKNRSAGKPIEESEIESVRSARGILIEVRNEIQKILA
jgi:hypothetical protein